MEDFAHTSVLAAEVLTHLGPRPGGVYCDGTVGGAGHASLVLEHSSPDGRLIGIDRDPDALAAAAARLARFGERATLVHDRFSAMAEVLARVLGAGATVDGILVDLGTSSPQLDRAERGFSFSRPGPLDMRMDPTTGDTALALLQRSSPEQLARILADYGEERFARRIAQRIKEAVKEDALRTTGELAALVEACIPAPVKRKLKVHPATKTFQALRIAVNDELGELERFLAAFPALLSAGGRCVVISFHSLEDRLVKRAFRDLAWSSSLPPRLARQAGERVTPVCRVLTRKAVFAGDDEVADNPRARSARLRACEKCAEEQPA